MVIGHYAKLKHIVNTKISIQNCTTLLTAPHKSQEMAQRVHMAMLASRFADRYREEVFMCEGRTGRKMSPCERRTQSE
jgi:hypothetical protein